MVAGERPELRQDVAGKRSLHDCCFCLTPTFHGPGRAKFGVQDGLGALEIGFLDKMCVCVCGTNAHPNTTLGRRSSDRSPPTPRPNSKRSSPELGPRKLEHRRSSKGTPCIP